MKGRIILSLFLPALLFFFDCEAARKVSKPKFGKVAGNVRINGQRARQHHYIPSNTEIEAKGKDSYFEVKFNNGSLIRVVSGKIILNGGKRNRVDSVNLLKGKFYAFLKKQGKRDIFRLETKDISIGGGQTSFMAEYDNASSVYVSEGEVEIWDDQKNKHLVKAGQMFKIEPPGQENPSNWAQGPKKVEEHIRVKAQQVLESMNP